MKYFAYCRKSSEGEERQALSIPAQIDEIKRVFDNTTDVEIIEWFEEKMSAKAPGRPVWSTMIKRIEKGEADGIVAWHPDRLARNSVDGGWIIHLLDRRVLKDLKFVSYSYEQSPQGMFMLQIMFGQSKYYVDNLSVNVKRGRRKKIALGWHPGLAPLGYLNDRASNTITPDPERFEVLRHLWDLLLTGAYSPAKLYGVATKQWGLRTPLRKKSGGGPVALATIYRIFSNPFYAGIIVANEEWYPGKHVAMITLDEFNQAQTIIGKAGYAKPRTHEFAFTGGVICCACGLSVTAEEKTKSSGRRYVYYHCTRRQSPRCAEPAVRVEAIEGAICDVLREIHLPPRIEAWFGERAVRGEDEIAKMRRLQVQSLTRALDAIQEETHVLLNLRTRKLIDDAEFSSKRQGLQAETLRLRQSLQLQAGVPDERLELTHAVVALRKYAADWFSAGSLAEKRLILETVGSNSILGAKKLSIDARIPFEKVSNDPQFLIWSDKMNHFGTNPANREEVGKIIRGVKFLEACAEARRQGNALPPAPSRAKLRNAPVVPLHEVRLHALRLAKDRRQSLRDSAA